MNRLSREERATIIRALVEGNSLRSTTRLTGHSINTVSKLLVDLGSVCTIFLDRAMRDLTCKRIQCDEIWSFVAMKARNVPEDERDTFGYGDVWTWTALDPDTKLIVTWLVSDRSQASARLIMRDLASRLRERPQITTDGNTTYGEAIEEAFGADADYGLLLKEYGLMPSENASPTARRYSPNIVTAIEKRPISGNPTRTTSPRHTSSGPT